MSKLSYFVIGLVCCLAFIVVAAPASTIWLIVGDDIQRSLPQVRIHAVEGSLWNGSSEIQFQSFPPARVTWKIAPVSLLLQGQVTTTLSANADGLRILLEGDFSNSGSTISRAEATISSDYINHVTLDYGLDLSGDFQLESFNAKLKDRWFEDVEGHISWSGGIVHIETPAQIFSSNLAPLIGKLSQDGRNIRLNVTANGTDMLDITLKPDGWAGIRISYAFLAAANLPLPPGSDDREEPAILLEEKIL